MAPTQFVLALATSSTGADISASSCVPFIPNCPEHLLGASFWCLRAFWTRRAGAGYPTKR